MTVTAFALGALGTVCVLVDTLKLVNDIADCDTQLRMFSIRYEWSHTFIVQKVRPPLWAILPTKCLLKRHHRPSLPQTQTKPIVLAT
jgi:hypothetical protein